MSQDREPKGVCTGGRFAGNVHAEASIFTQEVPPMEPLTGRLSESAAASLTAAGARGTWEHTKQLADEDQFNRTRTAMRNLAKNEATPPDVLHDMFVTRGKDGANRLVETRLGYVDEKEAMHAAIQNPNMAAETLHVIARGSGPEGSSDAARKKLKERSRVSWRARFEVFRAGRRAESVTLEQLKPE